MQLRAAKKTWMGLALGGLLLICVLIAAGVLGRPGRPSNSAALQPAADVDLAQLTEAVGLANENADASYRQVESAFRTYFRELRDERRLRAFVRELCSFQQKLQMGSDWWNNASSRESIGGLFRRRLADERQVAEELAETARAYQDLLAAQDYALLTSAGVDAEDAQQAIAKLDVAIPSWSGLFDSAIRSAVAEAQRDVARSAAVIAASNVIGNEIQNGSRSLGLNPTREGSWADVLSGVIIEVGTNAVVERMVDPADDLVKDFRGQLERTEAEALDGSAGLLPLLRQMNEAHQAARREWLLPAAQ